MPDENGDYLSRFERIDSMLEQSAMLQLAHSKRMDQLRMDKLETNVDHVAASVGRLSTKVDDLVGAIRNLIDRIPPESLR